MVGQALAKALKEHVIGLVETNGEEAGRLSRCFLIDLLKGLSTENAADFFFKCLVATVRRTSGLTTLDLCTLKTPTERNVDCETQALRLLDLSSRIGGCRYNREE